MRSQELQSKPKKWSWSRTQGEDGKMFGKIWKAINAKKRILLENYIRTQAEDRWADRDSFGCQQVSHICTSSPGTLPPSQRLPQLPAPLTRLNNGRWNLDGGPVIWSHQGCTNSKVFVQIRPQKKEVQQIHT
jgi:hypothetical protein